MCHIKRNLGGLVALLLVAILVGVPGSATSRALAAGEKPKLFVIAYKYPTTVCRSYQDLFYVVVLSDMRPVGDAAVTLSSRSLYSYLKDTDSTGAVTLLYKAPLLPGTDKVKLSATKEGYEASSVVYTVEVEWCLFKTLFGYSGNYTDPSGVYHFQETGSMAEARLEPDEDGLRYTGTSQAEVAVTIAFDAPGVKCVFDPPYEVTYQADITAETDKEGNLLTLDFSFQPTSTPSSVVITCSGGGITLSSIEAPYEETGLTALGLEDQIFAGTGGVQFKQLGEGLAQSPGSGTVRLALLPERQATASLSGYPMASIWRLFPWPFAIEGG